MFMFYYVYVLSCVCFDMFIVITFMFVMCVF